MIPVAILDLIKRLWPYLIAGGVALALIVALLITRHTLAESRKDLALCNSKQQINLSSIGTLQSQINAQNAAVGALKADGDKRTAAAAKALSEARAANAGLLDKASKLADGAKAVHAPSEPCVVSPGLKAVAGEL